MRMKFDDLPTEVRRVVLRYLEYNELVLARCVSTGWKMIVDHILLNEHVGRVSIGEAEDVERPEKDMEDLVEACNSVGTTVKMLSLDLDFWKRRDVNCGTPRWMEFIHQHGEQMRHLSFDCWREPDTEYCLKKKLELVSFLPHLTSVHLFPSFYNADTMENCCKTAQELEPIQRVKTLQLGFSAPSTGAKEEIQEIRFVESFSVLFPGVTKLRPRNHGTFRGLINLMKKGSPGFKNLSSLTFSLNEMTFFAEQALEFLATEACPALSSLCIIDFDEYDMLNFLYKVLQRHKTTLKNLKLKFVEYSDDDDEAKMEDEEGQRCRIGIGEGIGEDENDFAHEGLDRANNNYHEDGGDDEGHGEEPANNGNNHPDEEQQQEALGEPSGYRSVFVIPALPELVSLELEVLEEPRTRRILVKFEDGANLQWDVAYRNLTKISLYDRMVNDGCPCCRDLVPSGDLIESLLLHQLPANPSIRFFGFFGKGEQDHEQLKVVASRVFPKAAYPDGRDFCWGGGTSRDDKVAKLVQSKGFKLPFKMIDGRMCYWK